MSAPQRIFITDMLPVAGLVIYQVNKKRIQQSGHRLKDLLASRPGGSSGPSQPPTALNTAAAISAAADVYRVARAMSGKGAGSRDGRRATRPAAGGTLGPAVGGGSGGPPGPAGGGGGPAGGGRAWQVNPSGGGGSGGGRIPTVTGRVITTTAQMGLAHVTGGASTAVIAASRVLRPRPALPPGPGSSKAVIVRRPAAVGPGKAPLALPPGPSAGAPDVRVRRPGSRQRPAALPDPGNQRLVRRPGQAAPGSDIPAWRRPPAPPEPPSSSSPAAPYVRRPSNPQKYVRRPQGPRGR